MKLDRNDKWLFIGDSITDCGRAQPVGEGLFGALGSGYVQMVAGLLAATYPEGNHRVVNMGNSGNTVRDLKGRWQRDVFDQKPDWLSVMIGTNDVWRQFDSPTQPEIHVPIDEYEATYEELIDLTKGSVQGLILATPFYIEPNRNDPMRREMDRYGEVVKRLAAKHSAIFVDTQAAFDETMKSIYPATIAWDRVHPNYIGVAVLAKAFLDAIQFDW
ncbi:SGNH/GDSL hydrolase family protein [Fimbriimonas ginsengisoli]|uniref:SGNH/GDSL hydrolase family protein n=1 Tax=Fimbriimonas ginsengisoli TaxID=1005039 RepID=UPI00056FCC40